MTFEKDAFNFQLSLVYPLERVVTQLCDSQWLRKVWQWSGLVKPIDVSCSCLRNKESRILSFEVFLRKNGVLSF